MKKSKGCSASGPKNNFKDFKIDSFFISSLKKSSTNPQLAIMPLCFIYICYHLPQKCSNFVGNKDGTIILAHPAR